MFISITFLLNEKINAVTNDDTSYLQAPSYSAKDLVGNIVNLDDFKNNYTVLINVWATWCGPCKEEMPGLEKLYKQFSSSSLKIIGVSIDNSMADNLVQSYINKMGITYDIWRDPSDIFSMTFKTIGVPASFLINQNGEIIHRWNGQFDPVSVETKNLVTNILLGSETSVKKIEINSSTEVNSHVSYDLNQHSTSDDDPVKSYLLMGIPIAFLAGFLSFLSPCVLPLIPSFIAFITGMSLDDLKSIGKNNKQEHVSSIKASDSRKKVLTRGSLFILGFSIVFILLGASTTIIGSIFFEYNQWISRIGGIVLIIFGLHLFGIFRISILEKRIGFNFTKKPTKNIGSFIVGMGFGAGWTPCIGPILAGILTIAATSSSILTGITLLAVYSLGLAIPFIISSLLIERFLYLFNKFKNSMRWIEKISGIILIILGNSAYYGLFNNSSWNIAKF